MLSPGISYDWPGQNRLRRVGKGLIVLGPRVSSLFLSATGFSVLFIAFLCSFYLPRPDEGADLPAIFVLDIVANLLVDVTFLAALFSMLVAGLTDPGIIPPLGLDRCLLQAGDKYSLIRTRIGIPRGAGASSAQQIEGRGADPGDFDARTPTASPILALSLAPDSETPGSEMQASEPHSGAAEGEFKTLWADEGSSWGEDLPTPASPPPAEVPPVPPAPMETVVTVEAMDPMDPQPQKRPTALRSTIILGTRGSDEAGGPSDESWGGEGPEHLVEEQATGQAESGYTNVPPDASSDGIGSSQDWDAPAHSPDKAGELERQSRKLKHGSPNREGASAPSHEGAIEPSIDDFALSIGRRVRDLPVVAGSKYLKAGQASVSVRKCPTCFIFRPLRSHHCSLSDCCFYRFDHYCAWLGTAVAYRNHGWFLLLLMTATLFLLFLTCFSLIAAALGFYGVYAHYSGSREVPFPMGWFVAATLVRIALVGGGAFLLYNIAGLLMTHLGYLRRGLTTKEVARTQKAGEAYSEEQERMQKLMSSFNRGSLRKNLGLAFQGFRAPSLMGLALWRASKTAEAIEAGVIGRGLDEASTPGETIEIPAACLPVQSPSESYVSKASAATGKSVTPGPRDRGESGGSGGSVNPPTPRRESALLRVAWSQLKRGWALDSQELTELFRAQSDAVNAVLSKSSGTRKPGKRGGRPDGRPATAKLTTPVSSSAARPPVFTRKGMRVYELDCMLLTAKSMNAFAVWASTAQVKEGA